MENILYGPPMTGVFIEDGLKQCLLELENDPEPIFKSIIARYKEEERDGLGLTEGHYKTGFHDPLRSPFIDPNFWIFNCAIVPKIVLKDIGGFDAENFQCTAMAHADIRYKTSKEGNKS